VTKPFVTAMGAAFAALALAAAATPAAAEYPERVVKIQVGFPPGGGADILARWYADRLTKAAGGANFIIENRVGASGNLALSEAGHAKPDGYTLLFASTVTTAGNTTVFKQMPIDVTKDIVPIVGFAETPFVLCVAPDSPINSVADLTAFIKSKNGKATYGWATTSAEAATAMYLKQAGVTATSVGYKATSTAVQDVTGHQIDFAFADIVFAMGQLRQGRVKVLANASDDRSPALKDVPTLKELMGAHTGDIAALWGLWATAGTPQPILDKLATWMNDITKTEETQKFLIEQGGATPYIATPAQYKQRFELALKAWAEAAKLANIQMQ